MDELSVARLGQIKAEFSLEDPSRFDIYHEFAVHNEKHTENTDGYLSIEFYDHVKVAESFRDGLGQKLGYDSTSDTWFYEKWRDNTYAKHWKQASRQWGESTTKLESSEITEKWNWIPLEEESYEHFHIASSNEYGSSSGKKPGMEWKEIWHKKPADSALEKFWISGGERWGEKEGITGEKTWGLSWREEGAFFEEKSWNKECGKEWGHVEGKDESKQWREDWSIIEGKKSNDRWWKEGTRKWGVKTVNDSLSNTNFCEEWEEKEGCRRTVKTFDDGLGHKSQVTEGTGEGYSFYEDYRFDAEKQQHLTQKKGFSAGGKWESTIVQEASRHFVKNCGEDENGAWQETWEEEGGSKKAWKKGGSVLWGAWEEEWEERGGKKVCKKWGERDGEKWVEQWTEEGSEKMCRKEQSREGGVKVQEWKEYVVDGNKRSVGNFTENGEVVKEWDTTTPCSLE